MNRFDLTQQLADSYQHFPADSYRPVVGITGNYGELTCKLAEGYYKQVAAAGATPVIIPPLKDKASILSTLDHIDALLLSGGADLNPLYWGEEPSPRLGGINEERDLPELLITRLAYNRQMPILGICRGIQTLAVALGGRVAQDIEEMWKEESEKKNEESGKKNEESEKMNEESGMMKVGLIKHSQEADRHVCTHTVTIDPTSLLASLYSPDLRPSTFDLRPLTSDLRPSPSAPSPSALRPSPSAPSTFDLRPLTFDLFVNSCHHQAVADPGPDLRVVATAPDGIIEAVESNCLKPVMGVQWHPVCLGDEAQPLFRWLTDEASIYHQAQALHDHILSLDTHCDTPMFFPQGVDFSQRDDRILVDLPKMTEGRLDATIMVAYLPQKGVYEGTHQQFADDIFDRIEATVAAHPQQLAIARTPAELWQNKRAGRKSVMLGIENGIALDGRLETLEHFARRGVVYITLCHNGDNDICDSAKGDATHGGVSAFGAQVIAEMNRLGIMVDLSHGGEKSFYDALDISRYPIVCSHSSARALCDHPRNLTDDQMRALARKGGVCQITLYPGFLSSHPSSPASITDAMAHIDHAIDVMGIDHVGLGTDFDGDGGVPGLANASELINYTRQLLARRYNEDDIQKLWGGNFLRVMSQVQGV